MVKIKLESITPIHIWNGERYLSVSLKNGFRIHENLLIEKFLEMNKDKSIDDLLKSFTFDELKKIDVSESEKMYKLDEVDKRIYEEFREVQETIKISDASNNLKPYIPGSSIKGCILTSLLYEYLKNKDVGEIKEIEDYLSNPQKIKNKKQFFSDIEEFYVSDCILNSYKIKVGYIVVGRGKRFAVEVVDNFNGEFELEVKGSREIEKIINCVDEFSRKYLNRLKSMQELLPGLKNTIDEILSRKEKLMIIGKFTNLFSKSIQLILEEKGIRLNKKPRYPRYIRYFEINKSENLIGIVKISL